MTIYLVNEQYDGRTIRAFMSEDRAKQVSKETPETYVEPLEVEE